MNSTVMVPPRKSIHQPLAILLAALAWTGCQSVETKPKENRLQGFVVPSGPGVVWGRALLAGKAPAGRSLNIPGGDSVTVRDFLTDDDGGLANALVYVSRGLENSSFPSPNSPVIVEGKDFQFTPSVIAVQPGQPLVWRTQDPTGYNLRSHPRKPGNRPFSHVLIPNVTVETRYRNPELFLRHDTDISSAVQAHVSVIPHPFHAVTDEHGMFALPANLPPGNYTVTARHATAGEISTQLTIASKAGARLEFVFGAPGSGIANRIKSVDFMSTGSRTAARAAEPDTVVMRLTAPKVSVGSTQPSRPSATPQRPGTAASTRIETRVFRVNANRLVAGLQASYPGDASRASLRSLIAGAIGRQDPPDISLDPLPSLLLNAEAGLLRVRATAADMNRIQSVIEVLDENPSQIAIDARILEVDVKDFDQYIESHPVYSRTLSTENFNGILTEAEFHDMLKQLAKMKGARLIHAPGVATLSGSSVEIQFDPKTKLDIDPKAAPDGASVEMGILFAVFGDDSAATPRQSLKTTARALSRQTVMLGGLAKEGQRSRNRLSSRDKTVMMLLITPTLLDDSGKPAAGR